jgi:hypothetical protein
MKEETGVTGSSGHRNGLFGAAREVADRAGKVVRLEIELAKRELKRKVAGFAIAIGFAVVALICALLGLGFLFAAIAAAIATAIPTWAAILVVAAGLFLTAAGLGILALAGFRRGVKPEQAIEEARLTAHALAGSSDGGD